LLFGATGALACFAIWDTLRRQRRFLRGAYHAFLLVGLGLLGYGSLGLLTSIGPDGALAAAERVEPSLMGRQHSICQVGGNGRHLYYILAKSGAGEDAVSTSITVESDGFVSSAAYSGNAVWGTPKTVLPKPLSVAEAEKVAAGIALKAVPALSQLGSWQWQTRRRDNDQVWLTGAVKLQNGALTYPAFRVEVSLKTGSIHRWEAQPLTVPESALVTPTVTPKQAIQTARASGAVTGDATSELRYLPGKELLYIVKEGSSFLWVGAQSGKVLRDSRQP
jgi:hypothetical protein